MKMHVKILSIAKALHKGNSAAFACSFHCAPKNAFILQNSAVKSNFARGAGGFRAEIAED